MEVPEIQEMEISSNKFHPLYGRVLGVALEARCIIDPSVPIQIDGKYEHLITRPSEGGNLLLVHYPAIVAGSDMKESQRGKITFVPPLPAVRTKADGHRLQFRVCSFRKNSPLLAKIWFARWGEDKVFRAEKPKKLIKVYINRKREERWVEDETKTEGYLPLDFFGRRKLEFLPLFVKVPDYSRETYFVLEADVKNNSPKQATITVRQIEPGEAPPRLVKVASFKSNRGNLR